MRRAFVAEGEEGGDMRTTRRGFLGVAGGVCGLAVSGGCGALSGVGRARPLRRGAHDRLNVALIGVGGRGAAHVGAVCRAGERVAALCDVDEQMLMSGRALLGDRAEGVRLYKDFRVMLENEKNLDAVFVSTPDHMHGIQAAWAIDRGCHVYLETPLVRTLGEWRDLQARARTRRVLVQAGSQGSALSSFRRAVHAVASGVIGTVSEVHVWTGRPVWPQGVARTEGGDLVPPTLDWDLWLGVAPQRPYRSRAYHRFNWRGWCDFGSGALGDGGMHLLNLPFRALGWGAAVAVEAEETSARFPESYCASSRVRFDFASQNRRSAARLFWYDGGMKPTTDRLPSAVVARGGGLSETGCLLIGDKGVWMTNDDWGKQHGLALNGEPRMTDVDRHEAVTALAFASDVPPSQQQEFLDAVHSGKPSYSEIDRVAALTESLLAGCVAQRVPGCLAWNSRKGRFADNATADALVAPVFREGWAYPA